MFILATHSIISYLENPWTEEPGGLPPTGFTKVWIQLGDLAHAAFRLTEGLELAATS